MPIAVVLNVMALLCHVGDKGGIGVSAVTPESLCMSLRVYDIAFSVTDNQICCELEKVITETRIE